LGFRLAGVAQLVEQLICNQQVGGSNPFAGSILMVDLGRYALMYSAIGEMAERSKAADCKSADVSLRRFESFFPHCAGVVQR
jgi:hypothetical protein